MFDVAQDGAGNYYVAVASDVRTGTGPAVVPGYALVKFDAAGKELWRFPTQESAAVGSTDSKDRIGSFLLGSLASMHVTDDGDVWLMGMKEIDSNVVGAKGIANQKAFEALGPATSFKLADGADPVAFRLAHVAFLSRIDGAGVSADAPRLRSYLRLAVPLWWQPLGLRTDADGTLIIESTSGPGDVATVVQVVRVAPDLSKLLGGACFVGATAAGATGREHLVTVAAAAPEGIVSRLTAPLPAPPAGDTAAVVTLDFALRNIKAEIMKEPGRCWDLFGTRVMPPESGEFKIKRPNLLAQGQPVLAKVESEEDILAGAAQFEEYDLALVSSQSPTTGLGGLEADRFEQSSGQISSAGGELLQVGLGASDVAGVKPLVVANGRTTTARKWQKTLASNSLRAPGSLDAIARSDRNELLLAWTDLHLAGETNEGNRALRLAVVPLADGQADKVVSFEFEPPAETGHATFSSVRLAGGHDGALAIFATVGTREAGSPSTTARMKQAALLMGLVATAPNAEGDL